MFKAVRHQFESEHVGRSKPPSDRRPFQCEWIVAWRDGSAIGGDIAPEAQFSGNGPVFLSQIAAAAIGISEKSRRFSEFGFEPGLPLSNLTSCCVPDDHPQVDMGCRVQLQGGAAPPQPFRLAKTSAFCYLVCRCGADTYDFPHPHASGMEDAPTVASMQSSLTSRARYESSREASIDAARGAAMLFVCLSHFCRYFTLVSGAGDTGLYLALVGMVASPTFVIVSGMVAGFMFVARSKSFPHFRRKLVDRGVFLLVVGHTALTLTGVLSGKSFSFAYSIEYITDAIAVAAIIGPWLIGALGQKSRILLAVGIFAIDWCAILFWNPSGEAATLAKHYFVGLLNPEDAGVLFLTFPVIPWFAVYLIGTAIGERVGAYYAQEKRRDGHFLLAKIGFASFVFSAAVKVAFVLIKLSIPNFALVHPNFVPILSSYQKYPPGLTYICFYAGAGLLMVAGVLEAARRGMQPFLLNQLQQIGQASFFSFVLQFQLYHVLLPKLHLPYTRAWPLLFVFSLALLAIGAAAWNSVEGNRFLTLGMRTAGSVRIPLRVANITVSMCRPRNHMYSLRLPAERRR